jgi:hypothetical protein
MTFAIGDQVVWLNDGQEIPATVLGYEETGTELYLIEVDGFSKHVNLSELLAPKKAGFEIRDLVFVLNEGRDSIQGEIVTIGIGPKNRMFYQLKFEPVIGRAQSWYSEDEVFTVSDLKKKTILV